VQFYLEYILRRGGGELKTKNKLPVSCNSIVSSTYPKDVGMIHIQAVSTLTNMFLERVHKDRFVM
jgi:hypothetical protein